MSRGVGSTTMTRRNKTSPPGWREYPQERRDVVIYGSGGCGGGKETGSNDHQTNEMKTNEREFPRDFQIFKGVARSRAGIKKAKPKTCERL